MSPGPAQVDLPPAAPAPEGAGELRYFNALTGVRAVMMYLVFLCHYNFIKPEIYGDTLYRFSREFHVGVPVFYVLSGFLIYYRYGRQLSQMSWRWAGAYLQNRVARIYPIYLLLLTYTYLHKGLPRHGDGHLEIGETLATYTLTQAWFPPYVHAGIAQAWTLTIEETFYFLAPILFWFCHLLLRRPHEANTETAAVPFAGGTREVLSALAMCLAVAAAGLPLARVYLPFLGDWPAAISHVYGRTLCGTIACFGAGIVLARVVLRYGGDLPRGRKPYWTYLGSLGAIVTVLATSQLWLLVDPVELAPGKVPRGVDHPLGAVLVYWVFPVFVAAAMWGLITELSALRRFLGSPLLVLLGGSSYVFYLIHLGVVHDQIQAHVTTNYVARFVLLNLIAVGGFVLVEKPANAYLKNWGRGGSRDPRRGFPKMTSASLPWPIYLVVAGVVLIAEVLPHFFVHGLGMDPIEANGWLMVEDGPYETIEALLCLAGAIAFGWLAIRIRSAEEAPANAPNPRAARVWFGLLAAFCLLMFFEEISWGQRLLRYETPEWMTQRNYQGEFTLHNMNYFQPSETDNRLQVLWLVAMAVYLGALPWAKPLFAGARRWLDHSGLPVPGWPIAVIFLGWFVLLSVLGYYSSESIEFVIICLILTVAAESIARYGPLLAPQENLKLAVSLGVVMAIGLVLSLVQAGELALPSVRSRELDKQANELWQAGKPDEARALLEESLRIWPKNPIAHWGYGRLLVQQGEIDKGIQELELGIALLPAHLPMRADLAHAYLVAGRPKEAIATMRWVVDKDHNNVPAANFLAWVLSTTPDQTLRNGEEALRLAKQASESTDPPQATYLDTLAAAHAETGDFEAAIRVAKLAIERALAEDRLPLAAKIQDRLVLYELKQPYRDTRG